MLTTFETIILSLPLMTMTLLYKGSLNRIDGFPLCFPYPHQKCDVYMKDSILFAVHMYFHKSIPSDHGKFMFNQNKACNTPVLKGMVY